MSATLSGIYITGLFSNHSWQGGPTVDALVTSRMTDYILWSIHVHDNGDLYYNNELLASNGALKPSVADPLRALISQGRTKGHAQRVWLSIGAGGVTDFQAIETILQGGGALLDTLYANMQAIYDLGADGFDFDYEENIADPVHTLGELTAQLNRRLGAQITYCPYYGQSFWMDVLAASKELAGGVQPVVGYNLQCYSGGAGNDPTQWTQTLEPRAAALGIDLATFVRPGMSVRDAPALTPQEMAAKVRGWRSPGAWVWNSSDVMGLKGYTIADYAEAILGA